MNRAALLARVNKVAQAILGGPNRDVVVEITDEAWRTFEITVQVQTGAVHLKVESYNKLNDEMSNGDSHGLEERLQAWLDSGFATGNT